MFDWQPLGILRKWEKGRFALSISYRLNASVWIPLWLWHKRWVCMQLAACLTSSSTSDSAPVCPKPSFTRPIFRPDIFPVNWNKPSRDVIVINPGFHLTSFLPYFFLRNKAHIFLYILTSMAMISFCDNYTGEYEKKFEDARNFMAKHQKKQRSPITFMTYMYTHSTK